MNYCLIVGGTSEIAKNYIKSHPDKAYIVTETQTNMETLERWLKTLSLHHRPVLYPLDVRKIADIEQLFHQVSDQKILISEMIYLAGMNSFEHFLDISEDIWDAILDVNLKGCFFMMQACIRHMIHHRIPGKIVNISSQHGLVGNHHRAAYCASKAGMINLNRAISLDCARFGICVNTVAPTYVLTDKNRKDLLTPYFKKKYLQHIPNQRYCVPEDVVHAIDFFLSKQNQMSVGSVLTLDGGWTIQ